MAPEPGEEDALDALRQRLRHAERLAEAVAEALAALDDGGGAQACLGAAHRALARTAGLAGGMLDPALEALDRALAEADEARAALARAVEDMQAEPDRPGGGRRASVHAASACAQARRGARCAARTARRTRRQACADRRSGRGALAALATAASDARTAFLAAAGALSRDRSDAAANLDQAVLRELRPLRAGRGALRYGGRDPARERLGCARHRPGSVQPHRPAPMSPPGRLSRIASGGELARFMLALKVVTARNRFRTDAGFR